MVELSWKARGGKQHIVYAGWSGHHTDKSIQIDPLFAHSIELTEKSLVDIRLELDTPEVTIVEVEPITESDWEIIELHAGAVENQVISQTRTVQLNRPFIVYPTETISAMLKVIKLDPEPPNSGSVAKLGSETELHVVPKTRRSRRKGSTSVRSVSQGRPGIDFSPTVLQRGIALPHKLFDHQLSSRYEVFANFDDIMLPLHNAEYVNVSILPSPDAPKEKKVDEKVHIAKKIAAKLVHDASAKGNVGLSRVLSIALGVEQGIGFICQLEKLQPPANGKNPTLTFHPLTSDSKPEVDQLNLNKSQAQKDKEAKRQKIIKQKENIAKQFYDLEFNSTCLTNGVKLPALEGFPEGCVLQFSDKASYIFPIDQSKVNITIGDEILIPRSQAPSTIDLPLQEELDKSIGSEEISKKIDRALKKGRVGSLVYGPPGCGKSLIVNEIATSIQERGVYRLDVNCNNYTREALLTIKENIDIWLNKCAWHSPSLLVLEGLEFIFPAEAENTDSGQTRQLSEYFIQTLDNVMKSRAVSVIATTNTKESVNGIMFSSHSFDENFSIKAPSKDSRQQILEYYLSKYNLSLSKGFDSSQMSQETEGYLPSDLKVLVDRINHEAIYDSLESDAEASESLVTNELFTKATQGYTPSSLRGVKLQKSTTSWVDIGGLTEAKSVLLESLEWPTKYAPIFKAATLRLRSGILLYGYPGCGKTLLASAVAGQCGLNFISVKGPEILNKYIGASEQSVRELFERAQAAKPCILFFDEFDSIAPKRGHDSTGVTDRVVNQMLTQMDGAEGLDGVYVLAATSRPDLIDSALLRPGRLDKSVICDLPDLTERLSILKAITRNMLLSDDVSLQEIAEGSDGFSGADIQALGYNAYLQAVHEKLDLDKAASEGAINETQQEVHEFFQVSLSQLKHNTDMKPQERTRLLRQIEPLLKNLQASLTVNDDKDGKSEKAGVYIKHRDFVTALDGTKASISVSEKIKLSAIYQKFVAARDGNMKDGAPSNDIGARSTLA